MSNISFYYFSISLKRFMTDAGSAFVPSSLIINVAEFNNLNLK